MSAKIEFTPESPVVPLNSPKGTRVAEVKVVGMPEGITATELHLIDNASRRVELSGHDILLAQDLLDGSDMTVTVEAPVNNSFIDGTVHVQVRIERDERFEIDPEDRKVILQTPQHEPSHKANVKAANSTAKSSTHKG